MSWFRTVTEREREERLKRKEQEDEQEAIEFRGCSDKQLSEITDTQLIMVALHELYAGSDASDEALMDELKRRIKP